MSRVHVAILLVFTTSCAAQRDSATRRAGRLDTGEDFRLANLERAARYPWRDDGRCVVREASEDWATLVETCYNFLDRSRIRFVDEQAVCPVAQAGAISADEVTRLVGICMLIQPEVAIGAVVVIGAIMVAAAISAEIEVARAKKPGCYCKCLKVGEGPYIEFGRVASPAVCWASCNRLQRGYTGSECK